jgi:hypothetical protein
VARATEEDPTGRMEPSTLHDAIRDKDTSEGAARLLHEPRDERQVEYVQRSKKRALDVTEMCKEEVETLMFCNICNPSKLYSI